MATYEPTQDSLDAHPVPEWFSDAKLGIFIHWGVYSVPGWADPEADNAYAEWYPRKMYIEDSPTQEYHHEHYGEDFEYLDFAEEWTAEQWDPEAWAQFFADVGARYVVLTGEHHDGFPLWPSHYTEYDAASVGPERDIVGELCEAVRAEDLKFAASYHANVNYYQPGFEGPFGHPDYSGGESKEPGPEYVDFMNAKHRELIRRYEPDLLWFDTPQADAETVRSRELIADYYNRAEKWGKEVAVNDRASTDDNALAGFEPDESATPGGDFGTPEYARLEEAKPYKWESCRGIGRSFGYNRNEGPEHHLDAGELVRYLVDVVSKNGNLLINVGPRADGTIPELQRRPLEGLGEWLDTNGEAIYGTTYYSSAEAELPASDGPVDARFTWKDETLYAIGFEWPGEELTVPADVLGESTVDAVRRLDGGQVARDSDDAALTLSLPTNPEDAAPAYAFALDGVELDR
jgi:alpha-L-fucosidase